MADVARYEHLVHTQITMYIDQFREAVEVTDSFIHACLVIACDSRVILETTCVLWFTHTDRYCELLTPAFTP